MKEIKAESGRGKAEKCVAISRFRFPLSTFRFSLTPFPRPTALYFHERRHRTN